MKKIVCELCEGMEFTKEGGMFVCQGCGTKYTAEEARGMMREVEGGAAPVGTPAMPQVNPNQQQLDNILVLASTAYEADNYQEAESYCNRAIELDALSYKAWFLKAKAVGWSSKMDNPRVEEAAHSFCKAIDFAPEDEKESLKEEAVDQLKRLGLAMIATRKSRFSGSPSDEELNGFTRDRKVLISALTVLLQHGNVVGMPEGYLDEIATMMNEAGVAALNMARNAWNGVDHPSDKDLSTYIDWCSNIESLFRASIDASDEDEESDVVRYRNLAIVLEEPIGKNSQKQYWDSFWSEYRWQNSQCLTDAAVANRRKQAKEARDKADAIEKRVKAEKAAKIAAEKKAAEEAKQARIKAYWEAHADEKKALDAEKKELEDKKSKLNAEIAEQDKLIKAAEADKKVAVPSEAERDKLKNQIKELQNRRAGLGIFAGKEKKQIGEEIASLDGRVTVLDGKVDAEKKARDAEADKKAAPAKAKKDELQSQLNAATKRISAIDAALTKDPEEE